MRRKGATAGHVKNVRLTWDVDGAADLTLAPFGRVDPKGSRLIAAPDRDTSFTLEARNRLDQLTLRGIEHAHRR